jgi:MinD-like ATPase involved in chromosome partitioning or flagellar assembly
MIVTVGSIRGAPGATSWALMLGAAWPAEFDEQRVVLEADPAGGVIGARYGLGVEPGALRLVTAMRRNGSTAIDVEGSARIIDAGLLVVPGSELGEQARPVWVDSAIDVARRLTVDERVWIVDIGRSDETNPCVAFARHSKLTVLVVGARPEDLVQLPARVAALRRHGGRVAAIVSARCEFTAADVESFSGADAVWVVDPRSDLIDEVGSLLGARRARRSWLWRQSLEVAAGVAQLAHAPLPAVSAAGGGR